jgi:hypothetical protein
MASQGESALTGGIAPFQPRDLRIHSSVEDLPLDFGISNVPNDLTRGFILPNAKIDGMPYTATSRPRGVFNPCHQFGPLATARKSLPSC